MLRAIVGVVLTLLLSIGCSKQHTIPDGELALIFHDAFLSNAYATHKGMNLDSLRLYEPIFKRYGYTIEDVQYTIGSFSTRKSARLSDVVESSIKLLEREGEALDYDVQVVDTLNSIAIRRTTQVLHRDSLIWIKSMSDTTELKLRYESPQSGSYTVTFDYLIAEDDTTPKGYRSSRWVEVMEVDRKSKRDTLMIKNKNSATLTRGRVMSFTGSIYVEDGSESLNIELAQMVTPEGVPNLKIKNLSVKRVLSTPAAFDSLYRELLPIRIFSDELLPRTSEASL